MKSKSYDELWRSGQLQREAAKARDPKSLAATLGVTVNALKCGLRRLQTKDPSVPVLSKLFATDSSLRTLGLNDSEFRKAALAHFEELDENTNPDPIEEHALKKKLRESEARNRELMDKVLAAEDRLNMVTEAMNRRIAPIKPYETNSKLREGTAVFLVSDLHLEEEVKPEKVNYMNEFNLEIAEKRMKRLFESIKWFIESQRQSFQIKTACIWLGGDMFTNYLHDDNKESNLLAPPAAFAFAKQLITSGLRHILTDGELERIVIPCNDGNHGRMTKDLRCSTRAENSLENLMYGLIADDLKSDPRVEFEIAQGDHLYTQIYNQTIRWTHGAEVRGGNGLGGIIGPMYRAMARWETVRHADLTCAGHHHQRTSLRDLEMNSSLIGYNPFAMRIAARFEEPTQSAFMLDSKRGKSISAPMWVSETE